MKNLLISYLLCYALFGQAQTTKTPFTPFPSNYSLYYPTKMEGGFLTDSAGYKGFINKDGKTIVATEYDKIKTICDDFLVYKNAKCGIITADGKKIVPVEYDTIRKITDQYWFIKQGAFWGYKNNITGFTQMPIYDKLCFGGFEQNTKIWYKKGKKYGFISPNDSVDTPIYESLVWQIPTSSYCISGSTECGFTYFRHFESRVFVVQKGKKTGLVDIDNNELIPFKHHSLEQFFNFGEYYKPNERAYYKVRKGKKYGILYVDYTTKKTKMVIPIKYDKITFLRNNPKIQSKYLFALKKGKREGILTIEGKVFEPFKRQVIDIYKNGDIVITTLE